MQLPHAALPVDFPARGGPEASYQDKKSGYVRPTGRAQTTADVSTSDKPQHCCRRAPLGRDSAWPPQEAALARDPCATGATFGGANVLYLSQPGLRFFLHGWSGPLHGVPGCFAALGKDVFLAVGCCPLPLPVSCQERWEAFTEGLGRQI